MKNFALKGDIIFTPESETFESYSNSFLICNDGKCQGIYKSLENTKWKNIPVLDYTDRLIIPGFYDLHAHAPQYSYCGMGMDLPLLQWLEKYTFPEETLYSDKNFALKNYSLFVKRLARSPTCGAVLFGTIHIESDFLLADLLEKTGLYIYLGKVNMDSNSPDTLTENTEKSLSDTEDFIKHMSLNKNVKPIITPRFVPSCSSSLLSGLGKMAAKYNLPIQSHLDENTDEVKWVHDLFPAACDYASVYDQFNLLTNHTVMAHCIYLNDHEIELMKKNRTYIAHCPDSNTNLVSGAAPIKKYMCLGLNIGLGTDVAGGSTLNLFHTVAQTIQVSKLRTCLAGDTQPLQVSEAFYLVTKGGGSFFGNRGSFEKDFAFDALVINDKNFSNKENLTNEQRLERLFYMGTSENIEQKFVSGNSLFL